jgi:CheY-like chemotaxis protein
MHTQRQIEAVDILVVDPRVEHYHAFSAAMSELGISYQSARDGHQALQFAARKPGRIWLANLQLPDMTGIELLRLVRAKRPTTPFYLVSDFYSPEDERQARAAGAAGYFSKPVNLSWLEHCRGMLSRQAVRAGPGLPTPHEIPVS